MASDIVSKETRTALVHADAMRECILTIESTCDETAAAVIDSHGQVLASAVASQEELHRAFHGVVPEIAARAHLERILPIVDTVLKQANVDVDEIVAIAVATEPGLPGSLVVGLAAAKGFCVAWNKPLVTINHIQAHIYACQMKQSANIFPCIGFVVSGGHTHLYHCRTSLDWDYLGGTIDDAAGEAFDKVAAMLRLPFPGGPHLARLAERGDPHAYAFPRPMLHDPHTLDLSFSGLKTAVRYQLVGTGKQDFESLDIPADQAANIAASFQQAVVECLVGKAIQATKKLKTYRLCVGGGVAANRVFRDQLTAACRANRVELHIAPLEWCTDNAVMGALAWEKIRAGQFDSLDVDIRPGLQRRR